MKSVTSRFFSFLRQEDHFLYALCVLLLVPVLFVNLGFLPLMSDEGIRATVALEMDLSGNYFATTVFGSPYLNKPPLYNWIILAFFRLFQSYELWVFRLPSVLASLGFGYTVYRFGRVHFSRKNALLAALLFLTCGRILFNDTFLGLIDLTHSWVLFTNFFVIYHFGRKGRWSILFVLSYVLITLAFLMKGLPALVAQACTIGTYLLLTRNIRMLWSGSHLLGIGVFVLILGGYFYGYYLEAPDQWEAYLSHLWDQSEQRTLANYPWYESLLHIATYPLKVLYELFPAGLLAVALLRKDLVTQIKNQPFLLLISAWIIANNLVYWISPFWHARYIFWLFPLIIFVLLHFYEHVKDERAALLRERWIDGRLLRWFAPLLVVAGAGYILATDFLQAPAVDGKFWGAYAIMIALAVRIVRNSGHRLVQTLLLLIVVRWMAVWGFMPHHASGTKEFKHRQRAMEVAESTQGTPLRLLETPYLSEDIVFYLQRGRQEPLLREFHQFRTDTLYVVGTNRKDRLDSWEQPYTVVDTFYTRKESILMQVIRFEQDFDQ